MRGHLSEQGGAERERKLGVTEEEVATESSEVTEQVRIPEQKADAFLVQNTEL